MYVAYSIEIQIKNTLCCHFDGVVDPLWDLIVDELVFVLAQQLLFLLLYIYIYISKHLWYTDTYMHMVYLHTWCTSVYIYICMFIHTYIYIYIICTSHKGNIMCDPYKVAIVGHWSSMEGFDWGCLPWCPAGRGRAGGDISDLYALNIGCLFLEYLIAMPRISDLNLLNIGYLCLEYRTSMPRVHILQHL